MYQLQRSTFHSVDAQIRNHYLCPALPLGIQNIDGRSMKKPPTTVMDHSLTEMYLSCWVSPTLTNLKLSSCHQLADGRLCCVTDGRTTQNEHVHLQRASGSGKVRARGGWWVGERCVLCVRVCVYSSSQGHMRSTDI